VVRSALHWLGIGFVIVVPLTAIIGWVRYERTKYILGLSSVSIHDFFGSLGVTVQAWLLGVVLALTVGCYWSLGDYYSTFVLGCLIDDACAIPVLLLTLCHSHWKKFSGAELDRYSGSSWCSIRRLSC